MVIKVLGTGCVNCKRLKRLANEVVAELDVQATILEVTDIPTIMKYGIMQTPGLVIDEKLVGYGGVPNKAQLAQLIRQAV